MDTNERKRIGQLGVAHVAERLREFQAAVEEMSFTNPGFDLNVRLPGGRWVKVEVKTTKNPNRKPWWIMKRQHRNCADRNLYFAFVLLDAHEQVVDAFLLPSSTVERFINEVNDHYYSRPGIKGRDAGRYKFKTEYKHLPQYQAGWLEPYRDNWDVIFTGHLTRGIDAHKRWR